MTEPNWPNKTIFTGDNLYVMRGMNSESVDLIYLDPPFNSNRTYSAPIGSKAAGAAFKDTWTLNDVDILEHNKLKESHRGIYAVIAASRYTHSKGMFSYLVMMTVRLIELHRILKPTGSIYLHCDPTVSHYVKIVMDDLFGKENFRNEITWKRTFAHGDRVFSNVADRILFYGQPCPITDNVRVPLAPEYIAKHFRYTDSCGRYQTITLTGPKVSMGESGRAWRGVDPSDSGRCWSPPKTGRYAEWINEEVIPGYIDIPGVHARLDALDSANMIYWPKKGAAPRLKRYLRENDGQLPTNIWTDIPPLNKTAKEKTGYPTQKPLALLDRIVKASSKEGDTVFDPFAGCATTLVAAERLNRQWVGIDISPEAARLVVDRIREEQGLFQEIRHDTTIPQRTDIEQQILKTATEKREHKHKLYILQEERCGLCNRAFDIGNLEMDHVVPRALGGGDFPDNFQLLCGRCNKVKGTKTQEEAKALIEWRQIAVFDI